MFRNAGTMVAALLLLAVASTSAQEVQTPERAIPGRYIVVLNDQQVAANAVRPLADALARQHGGRVEHVYEHALRGFAITASATAAAALARNPRVRYVEQDSERFIVDDQPNATWGLDRIDQRDLPLNSTYSYTPLVIDVHVYIIDTGIRSTHTEFGGHVSNGYTAISDGNGTTDCNGHGTHVAGTIGGATYGVARGVTLHAVRVLNCSGSGTTSGVIAGVNWVTANHLSPAVANMSLGGGVSTALDDAVRNSVAMGVTYAIAAGNSNANACNSSPARVSQALTVGASTNADARASFSNFGTCVDLFAPGSNITSAWSTSDTATNTISGTSMASPHVAGAAALYLATDPAAPPAIVHAAVVNNASVDKLSSIGTGSPNRLLYSLFGDAPVDSPPNAAFTYSCTDRTCTFINGSTDDHGIVIHAWDFGDGNTSSDVSPTHLYGSGGTFTVTLTVTDTAGQIGVASQSVTVTDPGGPPCTGCAEYSGTLSGTGDYDIHPGGSWYYSGVSGTHRGWLQGPGSADFDLYLQKWNGFFGWVTVARSESVTSVEQIAYSGTAGYYRWIVQSYTGSGSYTFWLQRP